MGNNIKGITIEIGGDTTKLQNALKGVNGDLKSTKNELKEVEKGLKLDPKNTELLAQKQQLLTKAVGETKDKLDVLKTAEAQVEQQFKNGEASEEQYRAIKREVIATETELKNLFFIRMDARQLPEVFAEGEVDRIYLNFSDPWPKDRHAKRRLTSHEFLARYEKILKKDGTLEFKTDNKDLFDFSLEEMKNAEGWELTAFTYDLHHDVVLSEGNVMTEYEEKFSSIGNPICKMEARFL